MYTQYSYYIERQISQAVECSTKSNQYVLLKKGDTTRTAEIRVAEQAKTAVPGKVRLINTDLPPTKERDHDFHRFLQSQGIYKSKDVQDETGFDLISDNSVVIDQTGAEWFVVTFKQLGYKYVSTTGSADKHKIQFQKLKDAIAVWDRNMFLKWQGIKQIDRSFVAGLYEVQNKLILDTLSAIIESNFRTILWSVCARGQKTKMSLIVAKLLGSDVTIISSYVLSVFTSFISDIAKFTQTKDYFDVVDPRKDEDWKQTIKDNIKAGKKTFVLMSLCGSSSKKDADIKDEDDLLEQTDNQRAERMSFIRSLKCSKLWVVDEGDFGAHCVHQWEALDAGRSPNDPLIVMTGSNPERAISNWQVEWVGEILYTELIQEKENLIEKQL